MRINEGIGINGNGALGVSDTHTLPFKAETTIKITFVSGRQHSVAMTDTALATPKDRDQSIKQFQEMHYYYNIPLATSCLYQLSFLLIHSG
jgi:hypothetical protein